MQKRLLIVLGASVVLGACGLNTNHDQYGAVDVTASAPAAARSFTTSDGWTVTYDRFLVSVTALTIASSETAVVTASAGPQIFDAAAPGPHLLLTGLNRTARQWDDFNFQIAPATLDEETPITLGAGVTEADSESMTTGGFSIYVEGKASKGAVTKTMKWGFTTDTTFAGCEAEQDGVLVKGVVIFPRVSETVDLVFRGDVLLADDLAAPGAPLRFAALAAADADADGEVTLEELTATPLDAARAAGGTYGTAAQADVANLGAFTSALTQRVLGSFRAKGTCTASPTAAAAVP